MAKHETRGSSVGNDKMAASPLYIFFVWLNSIRNWLLDSTERWLQFLPALILAAIWYGLKWLLHLRCAAANIEATRISRGYTEMEMRVHCRSIKSTVDIVEVIAYVWFGIVGSLWILLKHHIHTPAWIWGKTKDISSFVWGWTCVLFGIPSGICGCLCCCGKR